MIGEAKTRIKICGITSLGDAVAVADLGADELGFNFYSRSPRFVEPKAAASIVSALSKDIVRVGVFVNESIDNVLHIAEIAGLDAIQLHGDESAEYVAQLKDRTERLLINAVSVDRLTSISAFEVDAVLIDSPHNGEYGGTGKSFNWNQLSSNNPQARRIYLAGGLSAENVADAVQAVRPYAVDACSRLESVKGRKDLKKVEEFIRAVREIV